MVCTQSRSKLSLRPNNETCQISYMSWQKKSKASCRCLCKAKKKKNILDKTDSYMWNWGDIILDFNHSAYCYATVLALDGVLMAKQCPMYWCMFMNSVRCNLQKLRLLLQLFNFPRSSWWLQFMGSMGFLWRLMRWWDALQIPRMHQPSSSARRKRLLWTRV